tara:strand:+ start:4587 stop:5417 length:831 start_codon:yes stop_codon:yes gene_type:complete
MFELWKMEDIIDKHKGKPAVISCHGPSGDEHIDKINDLHQKNKVVVFGVNEWWAFEKHPIPDYWIRAHTGANGGYTIEKDFDYFNKWTESRIPLLNCDTVDQTSLDTAKQVLTCPYLPFDNRHFNGKTCAENYEEVEWYIGSKNFTFFKDCCNRKGRLTIQEEFKKYTKSNELVSSNTGTAAVHMIIFAILMGCSPIYINGMDLDYFGKGGVYGKLKDGISFDNFTPGSKVWKNGIRRKFIKRDYDVINKSAKGIGVDILNLNHNTWYGIFNNGSL